PLLTPNVRVFYLLVDIFVVALISVLVLLLAPLLLFRRHELRGGQTKLRASFLGYFLLLGIGYVLIELSLLEELFLYIGTPTLTGAGMLGLMLALTGLGRFLARRFANSHLARTIAWIALAVALIQIAAI